MREPANGNEIELTVHDRPYDTTTTTRWPRVSTSLVREVRQSRCRELTLGLSFPRRSTSPSMHPDLPMSFFLSLSIETTRVAHTRTRAINILYISTEILTMAARGYVQSGREKEGKRDMDIAMGTRRLRGTRPN